MAYRTRRQFASMTPSLTDVRMMRNDATRNRIISGALRSMSRIGYHGTSMRTIAADAGVQPASLYHWYPSKETLLRSIMTSFLEELTAQVTQAVGKQTAPIPRLAAAVWTHVMFHGSNPQAAFVTDSEVRSLRGENHALVMGLRDGYENFILQLLVDGIDSGELRACDARIATKAILLQCTGVAVWFRSEGRLTLAQVSDMHVELVLHSLQSPTASAVAPLALGAAVD